MAPNVSPGQPAHSTLKSRIRPQRRGLQLRRERLALLRARPRLPHSAPHAPRPYNSKKKPLQLSEYSIAVSREHKQIYSWGWGERGWWARGPRRGAWVRAARPSAGEVPLLEQ